jgi:ribosomal-protein-alanine N-acetyltransferase
MEGLPIETRRLKLRLMRASDLDPLLDIFGDSRVMASFDAAPFTRQQMAGWLERNLKHQQVHGYGLFSVILQSNGVLIGDCGLEHMELEGEQVTELGYDFRSDYWNQGYATEAATAVRDFAFNELSLSMLISLIRAGNEASRRVSEKIGMRLISELRIHDISYWKYGVLREDAA